MSEFLYGIADVGGTQQRVEVWTSRMEPVGAVDGLVDPSDYYGSVDAVARNMQTIADGYGELVATSVAVASELDKEGRLILGGALNVWDGKNFGADVGEAAGLPPERSGSLNDMVAVAVSQLAVNAERGVEETGYVTTLSSGWGGKPYKADGSIGHDSPGHVRLRGDDECPCGGKGHAEAYITGNGKLKNSGVPMKEWLIDPDNASEFVDDLSTAVVEAINRNAKNGYPPEVIRWMGGVATHQPVLMLRAETRVREMLGPEAPVWEAVTLGAKAGLHGSFVDARRLAAA